MAVKIRLRRVGAKKQPAYRIVAADSRAPRDGRFIEILGAYNPLTSPPTITIHTERVLHWLKTGAQPTEVVKKMLVSRGVWALFSGEPMPEPVVAPAPVIAAAPAIEPEPEVAPVIETIPAVEETPAIEETPEIEAPAAVEEEIPAVAAPEIAVEAETQTADEAAPSEEEPPAAEEE